MTSLAARLRYVLRRALDATVRSPVVSAVATVTLAVSLFLTGLFAAGLHAGEALLAAWAGEVRISIDVDPAVDLQAARAAAAALAPGLAVEAVPAAEALRRFREALGPDAALADGLGPDVVPPTIELRAPGLRLERARALSERLRAVPGARGVDYGGAELEALERALRTLRRVGALVLAALALGTAVLVGNTLRLGVFARRDELEILRLVGATGAFVRAPFLVEGLAQGLLGGAAAAGALAALAAAAAPRLLSALALAAPLAGRDLVPLSLAVSLVLGGGLLGLAASALAVSREGTRH